MPYFEYRQKNSGGYYYGPAKIVIIEAHDGAHADTIAVDTFDIYFDGLETGMDCDCCGARWYSARGDEGDPVPSHYGKPITEWPTTHARGLVAGGQYQHGRRAARDRIDHAEIGVPRGLVICRLDGLTKCTLTRRVTTGSRMSRTTRWLRSCCISTRGSRMSDTVYVARFKCARGWWVVVEGDPTSEYPLDFLGVRKLHRGFKQVGEQYVTGFGPGEIAELRVRLNSFQDFSDEYRPLYVEVSPSDKENN